MPLSRLKKKVHATTVVDGCYVTTTPFIDVVRRRVKKSQSVNDAIEQRGAHSQSRTPHGAAWGGADERRRTPMAATCDGTCG
jgi:hypothetical protein